MRNIEQTYNSYDLKDMESHLKRNCDSTLINLNGFDLDKEGAEANKFAKDAFELDSFMKRISNYNTYAAYTPIAEEAKKISINPQILYSRYMHDTGIYRLRRVFLTEIN